MTGARLAAWEARAQARAGRRGPWRAGAIGLALGGALAGLALAGAPDDARAAATAILLIASAGILLGAPGRGFWTSEAALLGGLPIPGDALRSRTEAGARRSAIRAALLCVPAIAGAWHADVHAAAAGIVLAVAACTTAALLAPLALGGGAALATSAQHQAQVARSTGAGGPRIVFVAFVPAAFSAVLAVWMIALLPDPGGAPLLDPAATLGARGLLAAGPLIALALALATRAATARSLERATGRMAALDEERLAHVELDRARGLEALVGAGLVARRLYEKDVASARRRWPAIYILQGALVLAAWGTALAAGPGGAARLGALALLGLGGLAGLLGRLVWRPPVEAPPLLATLPIAPAAAQAAKLRLAAWRGVAPLALAAGPLVWRAGELAWVLALAAAAALVVALASTRREA